MSRLTDRLYRQWLGRNGGCSLRLRPAQLQPAADCSYTDLVGGMGGMPPMVTVASELAPVPSRGAAAANDDMYSRPVKQGGDYVGKSEN